MNIAVFTDLYLDSPGGVPSSVHAQKAELERLGHKVTVFCPGWKTTEDNVELAPTPKWLKINQAPMVASPKKVVQWVVRNHPNFDKEFDIVHVHYEAGVSVAGVKIARRFGLPLVQTMHGREDMALAINIPHPFKTLVALALRTMHAIALGGDAHVKMDDYLAPTLGRAMMWSIVVNQANAADVVLTPTRHFADKLKHYGVTKKIIPVSNAVSDAQVAQGYAVRKFESSGPLRMFWASRVSKEKRIVPFLQALMLLPKSAWSLEVCGGGNQMRRVKRLIKKAGIEGNVRLYGSIPHDQLLKKMKNAHLSIMASYGVDTQGMTLLEAEAVGLPVFYCDPDMKEVVPKGGGVMSEGPEPEKMAEALMKAIEQPKKIEEMSQVMLKHREEVLQSTMIKALLKVYGDLVKK